ncbi:MAG TPA: ATP-binding cassette domain-containing protein [Chitinophagaceae bacterium]|nr:ATP-binding cassette domain-containing protein [Chitinophagaceae bacterium]
MKKEFSIKVSGLEKQFGSDRLFRNLDMELHAPESLAILGANGSGKSTLLKLLATSLLPGKGQVQYLENGRILKSEEVYKSISFCAPYLEVIEEFNLQEFFEYHFSFKKNLLPVPDIIQLTGLSHTGSKSIEKFSSGMKQRVKLAQAILSDTPVLLLDEPCTNLDEEGIALYYHMMKEFTRDRIVVVASNDEKEYRVCSRQFNLAGYASQR